MTPTHLAAPNLTQLSGHFDGRSEVDASLVHSIWIPSEQPTARVVRHFSEEQSIPAPIGESKGIRAADLSLELKSENE
jgi:hypothetical protein